MSSRIQIRALILCSVGVVFLHAHQQAQGPLNDQRICDLVAAGVSLQEIVRIIATAPKIDFDLRPVSTDAMLKAGVSEDVIKAMAAREESSTLPVSGSSPQPATGVATQDMKPTEHVLGTVTAVNSANRAITVKDDKSGAEQKILIGNTRTLLKVEPGARDLKHATRIMAYDLAVGDRVDVRGFKAESDPNGVNASSVVLMSARDLQKAHEASPAMPSAPPMNPSNYQDPLSHLNPRSQTTGSTAPVLIYKQEPTYTQSALERGIDGSVSLSLVVDVDGSPRDIRVTRSLDPELDDAALEAVKRWRFQSGQTRWPTSTDSGERRGKFPPHHSATSASCLAGSSARLDDSGSRHQSSLCRFGGTRSSEAGGSLYGTFEPDHPVSQPYGPQPSGICPIELLWQRFCLEL